jgi:hypothetical protein
MKATMERETLKNAMALLAPVAKGGTLPVLSAVLMEADKGGITLTASNMEQTLRVTCPAVVDEPGEARELVVGRALFVDEVLEALAQPGAVTVVAQVAAADREDAPPRRKRAVAMRLEQRRHELAPGEVAGAAEEDEVEGHGPACRG